MRYAEAVARLSSLPERLPEPPAALLPTRTDTAERRTPDWPYGEDSAKPSAVLLLIAPSADDDPAADADILLIRRVDRGGHHAGQMAFPGGRSEPEDDSAAETALREANEEVALDPVAAGVRVIGELEQFWIPVSGYRVTPVLAIAARRPALAAAEAEVAEYLWAPVDAFRPEARIEIVETTVKMPSGSFPLRFGAYIVDGHRVWGATARILGQLGALLA
ncbi:MAG TPA: CoA pyrophosphatase [Candidatus Dormibacteraeota bacterium]|nr:CoA pyrophosphatase [Candidatus Dormibacteraeota bacterium]